MFIFIGSVCDQRIQTPFSNTFTKWGEEWS